jgi:hypothetical protein
MLACRHRLGQTESEGLIDIGEMLSGSGGTIATNEHDGISYRAT